VCQWRSSQDDNCRHVRPGSVRAARRQHHRTQCLQISHLGSVKSVLFSRRLLLLCGRLAHLRPEQSSHLVQDCVGSVPVFSGSLQQWQQHPQLWRYLQPDLPKGSDGQRGVLCGLVAVDCFILHLRSSVAVCERIEMRFRKATRSHGAFALRSEKRNHQCHGKSDLCLRRVRCNRSRVSIDVSSSVEETKTCQRIKRGFEVEMQNEIQQHNLLYPIMAAETTEQVHQVRTIRGLEHVQANRSLLTIMN
jgi:hypothetical protein